MELILVSLVMVAVFGSLAYPIFRPPLTEQHRSDALDLLVAQRDSAYQAIRDIDFDYQLGKLSENDYRKLRERYKGHAATLLQEIDALYGADPARIAPSGDATLECGNCKAPCKPGDKFCRLCGNKLG